MMISFFAKMQACGNDFVVLPCDAINRLWDTRLLAQVADRHYGVGCDQILLLAPSSVTGIDWEYAVYNADGSVAGHCVNGARCIAYWAHVTTQNDRFVCRIGDYIFTAVVSSAASVSLSMGLPTYCSDDWCSTDQVLRVYETPWGPVPVAFASMGNAHCLLFLPEGSSIVLTDLLAWAHDRWPQLSQQCNISFIRQECSGGIAVETYERGVGWTLSCGSASFSAALTQRFYDPKTVYPLMVRTPGGDLVIDFDASRAEAQISGEAHLVYTGQWYAKTLS